MPQRSSAPDGFDAPAAGGEEGTEDTLKAMTLTLDEVAAYLKAGKHPVYRLAAKGKLPAFKLGGTWRFRRSDMDE